MVNKIYNQSFSSSFICLGFPIKRNKNNFYNDCLIDLLSKIIAGNMMSLFIELREKHGLVYFVKSDYNIFDDFVYYNYIVELIMI